VLRLFIWVLLSRAHHERYGWDHDHPWAAHCTFFERVSRVKGPLLHGS
jgi:hypothetical protein